MEHDRMEKMAQARTTLESVKFRNEAILHGNAWMKSALADLKIDMYLITEHNSDPSAQLSSIERRIAQLESILTPSIFDPDPNPETLLPYVIGTELAQAVLSLSIEYAEAEHTFKDICTYALDMLDRSEGMNEAYRCLNPHLHKPGLVDEDVHRVIDRAKREISRL